MIKEKNGKCSIILIRYPRERTVTTGDMPTIMIARNGWSLVI